jgi:2-(1,2-epoxy-1,2-dihydrophenyl)acetyl-CoA isomerase
MRESRVWNLGPCARHHLENPMAESGDILLVDTRDAVTTLTLNRPEVLNAINGALALALKAALDDAEAAVRAGDVRAIVITGAGRGFCAGADLADPAVRGKDGRPGSDLGTYLRRHYHPIIEQMRRMPAPIISAVNGSAAGAGMSLALAADVVLAARSATFLQAFSKIGLIPDAGSTYFLPRLAGESRARAMAILADKIGAEQAMQFGLVWQVLPNDELLTAAAAMARKLATMPTRAYALIKEGLNQSLQNDLPRQLEVEAQLQSQAGQTEDFREGVDAFLGKRPPAFKGR